MVSARMERVCASPDGTENTAPWKVARTPALDMDSAESATMASGSAGATTAGTARIAILISSRIATTEGTTIKVENESEKNLSAYFWNF